MIKILALGDVVSSCGTQYLADGRRLAGFREKIGADLVVVNGENSADGNGILPSSADALFHAGADVITGGNHSWQRREIYRYFEDNPALIRPANYPDAAPGQGYYIADVRGFRVLCINLAGVVFMEPVGSAFDCGDRILRDNAGKYDIALIDVHAEATSEKEALGWYFAGRVAAVWGTHTHVATADERILDGGTGYISDLGMCGSDTGILGMDREAIIRRFRERIPIRCTAATENPAAHGVLFVIDESQKKCVSVERVVF